MGSAEEPNLGTAFIIRQFKRAEEIELMRRVYGRKFVQVSVYGNSHDRRTVLMDKIRRYDASPKSDADCERQAIELIDIDHNQQDDANGEQLTDVFHLGDMFVDGIDANRANDTISRFIRALFWGEQHITEQRRIWALCCNRSVPTLCRSIEAGWSCNLH